MARRSSAVSALLRVWDVVARELRERVLPRGHTSAVTSLDVSPDGSTLASADSRGIILWDLARQVPAVIHTLPEGGRVRFSPDGRSLATGFKAPLLWDVTGKAPRLLARLGRYGGGPVGLAFAPDGKRLAVGGSSPSLRLWNLGGPAPTVCAERSEKQGDVAQVEFAADGRLLAGARPWGGPLRLWRVTAAGVRDVAVPAVKAFAVAFSPDGRTLAFTDDRRGIHLWDLTSPVPSERLVLKGHEAGRPEVRNFAFSTDGRLLAAVGSDGRILVWETAAGKKLHDWKLPAAGALAFAADGRHLAVGNTNGTIYVLRLGMPR